ncbi:MAG: DUF2188 domain-containing protein [Treponema sp.]|nr:DUF2188 domain-containing protein [Treponema sp.]
MNYVVKYRQDDGKWLVKGFENDKVSKIFDVKGDAVAHAIYLAKSSGGSYIMVYSENGTGAEKIGV